MAARTAPASPGAADVSALGVVTVLSGPEELLADRAVEAIVAGVRAADPAADVSEIDAASLHPAALAELTSPSLFAASRVVVVRAMDTLAAPTGEALVAYAAGPAPDIALVLVHRGGQKGRGVIDKLRKAKASVIACDSMKSYELPRFVAAEVRRSGGRISEDAATMLVDAVGSDLRALTGAVSQLLADTGGAPVTDEVVSRYFAGRAEVSSFAVADAALSGRSAQALEQLRWALRSGVVPVLVTSALASGLRNLARLGGAARGGRDADLAREVGVPPWKIKTLRAQLRGWTPEGLAAAIRVVAQADADIKGAADDAAYALEKAVLGITRARG